MAEVEKNVVVENNNSQPVNATAEAIVLDKEALLEAVRNQLDYYFSKENLRTDTFLMSQMDAQMSVPLSVVMKFAKLRSLTQDEEIVKKALDTSNVATLVGDRIKSSIKSGRSTIILREIPSDTPEDEVRAIFDFAGAKPVVSLKSEIGDTWFVTMESEEDAKDTLLGLKFQKRTFQGASIKARLKSETVARSYYMQAPLGPTPVVPPTGGFPVPYYPPMQPGGYFPPRGDAPKPPASPQSPSGDRARSSSFDKNQSNRKSSGREKSSSRDNKGRNAKKSDAPREVKPKQTPVVINHANFPPLHAEEGVEAAEIVEQQGVGYPGEYKKYSIDDIINIVKNIKDATPLPENIKPNEHPSALSNTPNLDLLQRQRTFSIDETREQLRQGRPVQREAVAAGSVDYGVMMYGDDYQGAGAAPAAPVVGGSWAGVLKKGGLTPPPAPAPVKAAPTPAKKAAEKPAATTEKQETKKEGPSKKEKKERKADQKRARSDSNSSNTKGAKKDDAAAAQPSGWGGRPTFANVLKLKEEEAAMAENKASPSAAPAPKKAETDRKQDGKKQHHDNHDNKKGEKGAARPKNNFGNGNRSPPAADSADGMWVKGKTLPPK